MDLSALCLFSLLILTTYLIGGIAGFGGTVLAIAAVTRFVDIKVAVPALLIIGTVQSCQAMASNHRHTDRPALKRMLAWAMVGVPLGVASASHLDQRVLSIAFAIVSILSGLSRFLPVLPPHLPRWLERVMNLLLICAGVIHGAFAAGGAPVVVVAQHTVPRKESFRATLFAFWVFLNFTVVTLYLATQRFTWPSVSLGLIGLPTVLLATYLADLSARRISQTAFAHFVAALLIIAGSLTLARNLAT